MKNRFCVLLGRAGVCVCILVAVLALMPQAADADGIIPADRRIDWTQAGVPNLDAVRTSRTVFTNVTGLDTNGVLDCRAAIQSAINACPSNGIVMLPAGRLVISNTLYISANSINRGGYVTLRGASNRKTTFLNRGPGAAILTGNQNYGQSNNIVYSTLYQGTTNIMVRATPDFEVGDTLILARQDEPATNWGLVFDNVGLTNDNIVNDSSAGLVGKGNWYRIGSGDVFAQLVRCTAISGTNITFWPPLYYSWTNQPNLYAYCKRIWGASQFVGVESLTITNSAWVPAMMKFNGTYGSWVKDCKLVGYGSPLVMFNDALNCEVRDSDFVQPSASPPGGDVIGLEFNHSSAFKAENNSFSGFWAQLLLESSASGGVISYNYFTNQYFAAGAPSYYQQPDIYLNHEAHDMMNLLEGNIASGVQADNYHGSSSHNTFFRNWIHGMNNAFGFTMTNNIKCIDLCRYSYYYNIVGNILGSVQGARSPSVYEAPHDESFTTGIAAMYRLGFPDMGNDCVQCNEVFMNYKGAPGTAVWGYPISFDPRVTNTLLRLCNYDYVTHSIPDGTATLPDSLIYNNPPNWWGNRPWPAFDPKAVGAASATNLSAGYSFYFGRKTISPPSGLRMP